MLMEQTEVPSMIVNDVVYACMHWQVKVAAKGIAVVLMASKQKPIDKWCVPCCTCICCLTCMCVSGPDL